MILESVVIMVTAVAEEGASVMVHCSDGWDRTAQMSGMCVCVCPTHLESMEMISVWFSMGLRDHLRGF